MTVTTTYEPARYTGDGSTTEFALGHLVYESSHLSITIDDVLTSAWSAATYGSASGVTVTFDSAPANGAVVVIQRIVPYTQDTDLENFDGNPADVTEKQFDLLAMADQQIAEESGRTIVAPIGTTLTSNEITGTIDTNVRLLTITAAGPATSTLGSISTTIDTVFTSEGAGDLLMYDGSNWVNETTLTGDYTFSGANTFSGTTRLTNNNPLVARNNADSADIEIIQVSASDVVELPEGVTVAGSKTVSMGDNRVQDVATPTAGTDAATKAYVDGASGIELETKQATTSGDDIGFTGISSDAKEITFMLSGVSLSGTDNILFVLGDSGGYETSGYVAGSNSNTFTVGFGVASATASNVLSGAVTFSKFDDATNTWVAHGVLNDTNAGGFYTVCGYKSLSGNLDRIRISTSSSNTFDNGEINIQVKT